MLSTYQQAQSRGCSSLAVTTGGKLGQMARAAGAPLWEINYPVLPRAAAGFLFGLFIAALYRLDLLPDPSADYQEMLAALRQQQEMIWPESPIRQNSAKRLAGQMVGRCVVLFGADALEPAARRWKNQINENAKTFAWFETLPEADHNALAGIMNPEAALSSVAVVFLVSKANHPRNQIRLDFTRQILMSQGINTDVVVAQGQSRLAQIWTITHYGDYTSYYMAMAYGEDPLPVDALAMMKQALASV
jgi:glucose/mannose-6-phosphate isomerase